MSEGKKKKRRRKKREKEREREIRDMKETEREKRAAEIFLSFFFFAAWGVRSYEPSAKF